MTHKRVPALFAAVAVAVLVTARAGAAGTNETLLWGSYTAELYMGMRARDAASPRFGVAWSRPEPSVLRYKTLGTTGVDSYTWHAHDGVRYGAQDFVDAECGVTVKGAWLKTGTREWTYRVSAEAFGGHTGAPAGPLSVTLFWADPEGARPLRAIGATRGKGAPGRVVLKGVSSVPGIGAYSVVLGASARGPGRVAYPPEYAGLLPDTSKGHCLGVRTKRSDDDPGESLIPALQLNLLNQVMNVKAHAEAQGLALPEVPSFLVPLLPDESAKNPNTFFVQRILSVPFTLDVAFIQNDLHVNATTSNDKNKNKNKDGDDKNDDDKNDDKDKNNNNGEEQQQQYVDLPTSTIDKIYRTMSGDALTPRLEAAEAAYSARVLALFPALAALRDDGEVVNERFTLSQIERFWAKNALANTLGGLSFFSGDRYADEEEMAFADEAQRRTLFTTVESKSRHQYGTLAEAGLAQILVAKWDVALMRAVVASWFANQDPATGYLPGLQVFGAFAAAAAKAAGAPARDDEAGTAPTFLYPLSSYLEAIKARDAAAAAATQNSTSESDDDKDNEDNAWFREMYPKLVAYYDWLRENQAGPVPYTFTWSKDSKGRRPGSGMPTYPRGTGESSNDSKDNGDGEMHLDGLCWMLFYAQFLEGLAAHLGEDGARFGADHAGYLAAMERYHLDENSKLYHDVARYDAATDTVEHAAHFGVVSLFPLIMTHVRADAVPLGATLRRLEAALQTPFGLATLATDDRLYAPSAQWRGGVSVGATFLALNALRHYGTVPGPQRPLARRLYNSLRAGMLDAINKEYSQLAFVYEWYDSRNGKGYGAHPTTGSSSLAVFILAEPPFPDL